MSSRTHRYGGVARGFRSGLEEVTDAWLKERGIDGAYEDKDDRIRYTSPETKHTYTRDFRLPNGIIIETKGRFLAADRKKHLLIKQQHPHLDVRFVFDEPRARLTKAPLTFNSWLKREFGRHTGYTRDRRDALMSTYLDSLPGNSYAQWCDKNGFKWAEKTIPEEWLKEKTT